MGYNGTTLFSTLAKPTHGTDGSVFFEDPYARNIAVQCASVADSPHNMLNITYRPHNASNIEHAPAYENLSFDLRLTVSISQNTTMKFISSPNLAQYGIMSGYDFSFGGRKVSSGAPPNYWMNDVLAYLPWHQPNAMEPTNNMSMTAFAYISLRPNAFRMGSVGGDVPVAIETRQFQVRSWVEEPSAPTLETLEDLNVTFYIWPIICSLSVHNVTAWVRVRGDTRLERTNASTTVANLTRPSGKWILPSDPMETSWSYIMDLLFLAQQVWISDPATPLEKTFNQTWTLTSLEDQLSRFSAFYYSVLVQHWRTAALNGDLTASSWWNEATESVAAHQLTLIGRLDVSISQLVLGCVCMIALIITSAISILGVRIHQGALMDGGVMNMISLLRGSSLPGIISGDHDEVLGHDGRRRRAERTIVMFKNSILDVPERLEDEIFLHNSWDDESRGLQSSLGAIALSERVEDERLGINSGDRERTDLQHPMRMIRARQQQQDEDLSFLSDDPVLTDSRTSLRTMTLPERLEGDDPMNSEDPENFQNSPER
ncbi:hypothetical protein BS47DRAFT_49915 [Hydnum rufescens UP504]|uniref:Uncharacterized protein n=1 Tax=Hydnum rufescens UP504 TaxID=1448309 RepID=A0A9P6ARL8_9AGAM|nr:hypothetical protein BS47DRAFT_49915 [Hydnum rufescens UP504]